MGDVGPTIGFEVGIVTSCGNAARSKAISVCGGGSGSSVTEKSSKA